MTHAETISATLIPKPLTVSALAKRHGVHRSTIQRRLKKGWTPPAELPLARASAGSGARPMRHAAPSAPPHAQLLQRSQGKDTEG